MEVIKSLIQDLALIVMLALFLEMLLPAGEVKQYVKMVLGLLLAVALLQAAGGLVHRDFVRDVPFLTVREDSRKQASILEAGKKLAERQQEKAAEEYRRGLSRQVLALARMNREIPVADAEVRLQESQSPGAARLEEIILYVRGGQWREPGGNGPAEPLVEPVSVRVRPVDRPAPGLPEGAKSAGPEEAGPAGLEKLPAGALSDLKKSVAGFYNLTPDRV
ncbi:MAG: stage III sporulation protein AF, partial [Firmicutes bacterium]|nr:stage III sporulation protein AF [Bacillota bacterium]